MKKTSAALAAIALSTLALTAACSSSSTNSSDATAAASTAPGSAAASTPASAAPSASGSMVGGMATCDAATLQAETQKALDAAGEGVKVWSIDGVNCADGWAVAQPTVGKTEANAVTETLIFQAEGQFWIPKKAMDVCGTQGSDPSKYVADSQVPEAIYAEACGTN